MKSALALMTLGSVLGKYQHSLENQFLSASKDFDTLDYGNCQLLDGLALYNFKQLQMDK
jgi:hypothetical protein